VRWDGIVGGRGQRLGRPADRNSAAAARTSSTNVRACVDGGPPAPRPPPTPLAPRLTPFQWPKIFSLEKLGAGLCIWVPIDPIDAVGPSNKALRRGGGDLFVPKHDVLKANERRGCAAAAVPGDRPGGWRSPRPRGLAPAAGDPRGPRASLVGRRREGPCVRNQRRECMHVYIHIYT